MGVIDGQGPISHRTLGFLAGRRSNGRATCLPLDGSSSSTGYFGFVGGVVTSTLSLSLPGAACSKASGSRLVTPLPRIAPSVDVGEATSLGRANIDARNDWRKCWVPPSENTFSITRNARNYITHRPIAHAPVREPPWREARGCVADTGRGNGAAWADYVHPTQGQPIQAMAGTRRRR